MTEWIREEGKYTVKNVVDGDYQVSVNGNPYIELVLELDVDGEPKQCTYQGYLTEKTVDITAKEMSFLGFNGSPKDLLSGSDNLFSVPKNVIATVVSNEADNGKTYYRASWINMRVEKKVNKNNIESFIEKNNLDGLFMKFKNQTREKFSENFKEEDNHPF